MVAQSSGFCVFDLGQGSLNCWFFWKCIYTSCPCYLPVAQPPEESLKKEPSINKVLREEKEDIEAQKYDAGMILWYSKI